MFELKKPCVDCPFRKSNAANYALPKERLDEILSASAFECHKTTGVGGKKHPPQQCAGLIAAQHAANQPNQITQVAQRLLSYDPSVIDTSDTFDTIQELYEAHSGA